MKIMESKNYRYKKIIKSSEYNPDEWHLKLQNITEAVHKGVDVYEAINNEFINLSTEQVEQVKDYVFQALGKSVPTSNPEAYSVLN